MNQNRVRIINLIVWGLSSVGAVILKKADILPNLFWFFQSLCFANIIIIASSFFSYKVPKTWTKEIQIVGIVFGLFYNAFNICWLYKLIASVNENYFVFINNMEDFNMFVGWAIFLVLNMIQDMQPRKITWPIWTNLGLWLACFALLEFRIVAIGPPIESGFSEKAVHEMFFSILIVYFSYLLFIISGFFSHHSFPKNNTNLLRTILTIIIIIYNAIFLISFASLTKNFSWKIFAPSEVEYYLCVMTLFLGVITNFISDIPDATRGEARQ